MSTTIALTPEQKTFLAKHLRGGLFNRGKDKKTTRAYEAFVVLVTEFAGLSAEIPHDHKAMTDILAEMPKVTAEKDKGNFDGASTELGRLIGRAESFKTVIVRHKTKLLQDANALTVPAWAVDASARAMGAEKQKALAALTAELPTQAEVGVATRAIKAFNNVDAAKKEAAITREGLVAKAAARPDPAGIDAIRAAATKAERDKITAALTSSTPAEADLKKARAAFAELDRLVLTAELATTNPAAANKMAAALTKFRADIGDEEATPDSIADAAALRDVAEAALQAAEADIKQHRADKTAAKAMPNGAKDEKRARRQAWEDADDALEEAKEAADDARAEIAAQTKRGEALIGQRSLVQAVRCGALSAESGTPISPGGVEKLIAAYSKNPIVADQAVAMADKARFPETLADNAGAVCDQVGTGFESSSGRQFVDPDYARSYGANLLEMGGELGPDYFARLPDYIDSGQQFVADAHGDNGAQNRRERAQNRSVALAGKLVQPDGTIDLTTDDAKNAVGNLLYHPGALRAPLPAMNGHVLKTMKTLSDPATGTDATAVLKSITAAPTSPAAGTLLRKGLGKADTYTVSTEDTRTAVMAAMLQPVDQGPAGSCFATAPVRKLRETEPVEAMKALAQIASTGTYQPQHGAKVPAVTNVGSHGDPLIRSLEYSLATSAARDAASGERNLLTNAIINGAEQFKRLAVTNDKSKSKAWKLKKAKLIKDVSDAFTFEYDSERKVVDPSDDGMSSQGAYVIIKVSDGKPILTQAEFEAAMGDAAVASLGAGSDAAKVRDLVKTDAFIKAVTPGKYRPWELAGGGRGAAACRALSGTAVTRRDMVGATSKGTAPAEDERAMAILASVLTNCQAGGSDMLIVETTGQHTFNALPNDPSLTALRGTDDAATTRNLDAIVSKAAAMKDIDLSADRAAFLFDREIEDRVATEADPALVTIIKDEAAKKRPTGAVKPAALSTAIADALRPYNDHRAEKRAQDWNTGEVADGRTPPADALAKKRAAFKQKFDEAAAGEARGLMARSMGSPQIVIADTNWGDAEDHTLFVFAPDPTTGKLQLWTRTEPPGLLMPIERDWLDRNWVTIQ